MGYLALMLRFSMFVMSLCVGTVFAAEGKWTPQQVLEQGPRWVKNQGFELPLRALWDEKTQGGLLGNAVQLPGCSGSFVSAQGLLITNHHCIVSILQEHSTPERNLVKDGFLAKQRVDEKPAKAYRIQVPQRFRDVTKEVLAAVPAQADDHARFKAVESTEKKLVAECEQLKGTRCRFATFGGGLFFTLTEFTELTDVRLVYAPPEAVGNFGGEIDNWMWPRHSGDFALVRVYVDGKPYNPKYFFPLSLDGVKENQAVAVLGYPGNSFRELLALEVAEKQKRFYPGVLALTTQWLQVMEEERGKSPDVVIATADGHRGLLNVRKNAEGQLAGLQRGQIVEKQGASEDRVKAFAQRNAPFASSLEAYAALEKLSVERGKTWEHDFLFDWLGQTRSLRWPLLVARRAVEGQKADAEREPGYQERDLPRLREQNERDQKRYAPAVEQRLFTAWVQRMLALPAEQRSAAVDALFGSLKGESAIAQKVVELTTNSKVFDLEQRKLMFEETPAQQQARKDALLHFAMALDVERRALRDRRETFWGRELELRPMWRKAVIAEAGRPVAADANSTLRVSFGRVKGYSPRDAVVMSPHTSLAGVMAKHTGEEPFDVPQRIREAFAADPHQAVPVDFLADCDTTGGNSGSPVIDGKGRLVGVNFDRVWENVANDFGYNPDVARNVVADVRYLLWLLKRVEHAPLLVDELTGKSPKG